MLIRSHQELEPYNQSDNPPRSPCTAITYSLALLALATPAYADTGSAAYIRQMRSLYPNGTDENLLAVGNWACDRTPLETFDELYEGLSQTHSPGAAEAFAYNVSHAAHETLCPGIEINEDVLLSGDEIVLRESATVNSGIRFRTSGRTTARASSTMGNWVGVIIHRTDGDRFGWVHKSQVRFGSGD